MSYNQPKRISRRLAGQRKRRLEEQEATASAAKERKRQCYGPKATDPAILQDCGILPSE